MEIKANAFHEYIRVLSVLVSWLHRQWSQSNSQVLIDCYVFFNWIFLGFILRHSNNFCFHVLTHFSLSCSSTDFFIDYLYHLAKSINPFICAISFGLIDVNKFFKKNEIITMYYRKLFSKDAFIRMILANLTRCLIYFMPYIDFQLTRIRSIYHVLFY